MASTATTSAVPVELAERESLLDERVEQPIPLPLHLLLHVGSIRARVVLRRQVRQDLVSLWEEVGLKRFRSLIDHLFGSFDHSGPRHYFDGYDSNVSISSGRIDMASW